MATRTCALCLLVVLAPAVSGLIVLDIQKQIGKLVIGVMNTTANMALQAVAIKATSEQMVLRAMQGVLDQIHDLEEKGVHVACSATVQSDRLDIAKNLTDGIVQCVTNNMNDAQNIVHEVSDMMVEFNATLAESQARIDACKNETLSAVCMANEQLHALTELTKLGNELLKKILDANKTAMGLWGALVNCPQERLAEAKEESAKLVQKINDCVTTVTQ